VSAPGMSGYGEAHSRPSHGHERSPISVGWVILSATLIGLGLLLMAYFLLTFNLLLLVGIAPCVAGGLMLFDRRAGFDSA
jgi:membrane-bound ClpP family serine protease